MFERDKDELRDLGIPLVTEVIDPLFDDELGYRIDRREYALPPVDLALDEVTALVRGAGAEPGQPRGCRLDGAEQAPGRGVEIDERSVVGIEPTIRTAEPAFDAVRAALVARQVVSFEYRKPDGSAAAARCSPGGSPPARSVVPHRLRPRPQCRARLPPGPGRRRGQHGRPGAYAVPADHRPRVLVAGLPTRHRRPRAPRSSGSAAVPGRRCDVGP